MCRLSTRRSKSSLVNKSDELECEYILYCTTCIRNSEFCNCGYELMSWERPHVLLFRLHELHWCRNIHMMISAMSAIKSMCESQQKRSCEITNWLTLGATCLSWVAVARYFLYIGICMSSFYIDYTHDLGYVITYTLSKHEPCDEIDESIQSRYDFQGVLSASILHVVRPKGTFQHLGYKSFRPIQ